jgi:hypothetical protein
MPGHIRLTTEMVAEHYTTIRTVENMNSQTFLITKLETIIQLLTSCLIVWTLQSRHGLIFSNKGVNIGNQGHKSHAAIILEEVVMLIPNNYKELCFLPVS